MIRTGLAPGILLSAVVSSLAPPAVARAAVRVWESTLELPTDEEGPPDPNPPFELFLSTRFSYPYTLRESLTGRQSIVRHRSLNLENEHLRCVVLPDLGGHLYNCVDKATGADLFYANRSLRKAQIGYRGVWAAFGVEFNFPVSHNWVSLSPVDFATRVHEDGSASVFIGNVDRVYGLQWRVELRLAGGTSLLEQRVALYNPSPVRHRFYWWNNAAVRVRDTSRIVYPMRHTASHWFREIDTWPVNAKGVDLSIVGNHLDGPVSLFAHGSREGFMGVYHPWNRTGVVHYSSPEDAPTKKIWSWGGDADGRDWRRALSDDASAYVEVQSGLFRNQETYGLLQPQGSLRFAEYWAPVRGIGGISRANAEAVVHLQRSPEMNGRVDLRVGVNVTRAVQGGLLHLSDNHRLVAEEPFDLTPAGAVERTFKGLTAAACYTLRVLDGSGRTLMEHTEGLLDVLPDAEVRTGPQPFHSLPLPAQRSEGDFLEVGLEQEREGERLAAFATYGVGLERFPESLDLLKARGRMAVDLQRFAEAVPLLERALARSATDPETLYYLGLALAATGRDARARAAWEGAQHLPVLRAAARLELSRLDARSGRREAGLRRLRAVVAEFPEATRAGELEVTLLRSLGRDDEARQRLRHWFRIDPTSNLLRNEAVRLGVADAGAEAALWRHLAGEPERVLSVASEYMGLGLFSSALELLERRYPTGPGVVAEPGNPLPQDHPLVVYYRGYCREKTGGSAASDFAAAARLSSRYVFPSRADSLPVLRRALELGPNDASARLLLGSLHFAGGEVEAAVEQWRQARRLNPNLPVLHRNLGMALLHVWSDAHGALEVLREGMDVDRRNVALYLAADQAASLLALPVAERVALLERFPDCAAVPPAVVHKLTLALVEVGRAEEAEALFRDRFFPREEWGTNVRQVFLEVRLRRALALARAGRHREAAVIVRTIERPVSGLMFTRDGLHAFLDSARVQLLIGDILAVAGRPEAARRHWERAREGNDGSYLKPVHAALAERRLGRADEAVLRKWLEEALVGSETLLAQGTNFPAIVTYAQGLTLRALGREHEARERFRRVFALPDQRLAHFLARRALEANEPL